MCAHALPHLYQGLCPIGAVHSATQTRLCEFKLCRFHDVAHALDLEEPGSSAVAVPEGSWWCCGPCFAHGAVCICRTVAFRQPASHNQALTPPPINHVPCLSPHRRRPTPECAQHRPCCTLRCTASSHACLHTSTTAWPLHVNMNRSCPACTCPRYCVLSVDGCCSWQHKCPVCIPVQVYMCCCELMSVAVVCCLSSMLSQGVGCWSWV